MISQTPRSIAARLSVALVLTMAAATTAFAPTPAAAWDLTIMASGWETDALGDVGGGGLRLSWALTESVTLDVGAYYIEELRGTIKDFGDSIVDLEGSDAFLDNGFEVIPIDIGIRLGRPGIYLGGGGSFFKIDAPDFVIVSDPVFGDIEVPIAEVDDEVGYYGVLGWEFGSRTSKVFIEAMYRWMDGTVTNADIEDFEVRDQVDLDLSGPQYNIGFTFAF